MSQATYERTELSEARRRLKQANTLYDRHLEKHRKVEAEYRTKIAYLEDRVEDLQKAESN
jgi:hypothetical protein